MINKNAVKINQITKEELSKQKFNGYLVLSRLSDTIQDIEIRLNQSIEVKKECIKAKDRSFKAGDWAAYQVNDNDCEYLDGKVVAYENALGDIRQLVKMLKCNTFEEGYYVWGDLEPSIDEAHKIQASEGEFKLEWEEI